MITVLTSFSQRGFSEYGARFIDTFRRYWPTEVELLIYHEGQSELGGVDLLSEVPSCVDFIHRHRDNLVVQGRMKSEKHHWKKSCLQEGYNFRFDAYKFSRKVFAIEHASKRMKTGRLFWVDADVITFDRVTLEFLIRQLPTNVCTSYLGRARGYHSECGFVGYNLDQPRCHDFINVFASLYRSDTFMKLAEWHDSWVYDWVRMQTGVPALNLSPPGAEGHVFIQSELGKFMDHLKGDRKQVGRSYPLNYHKAPHDHPYWKEKR